MGEAPPWLAVCAACSVCSVVVSLATALADQRHYACCPVCRIASVSHVSVIIDLLEAFPTPMIHEGGVDLEHSPAGRRQWVGHKW